MPQNHLLTPSRLQNPSLKNRPYHVAAQSEVTPLVTHEVRGVAWDFDLTQADTERLHRITFQLALEDVARRPFQPDEWQTYRAAFGRPEPDTAQVLASTLGKHGHGSVSPSSLRNVRMDVLDYFLENSTLQHTVGYEGRELVFDEVRAIHTRPNNRWIEKMQGLRVPLLPGVLPLMQSFQRNSIPQGIATSSGSAFMRRIISAFGLNDVFTEIVSADDLPSHRRKPAPDPYLVLRERLGLGSWGAGPDFLAFEDSEGGTMSAFRAGARVLVRYGKGKTISKIGESLQREGIREEAPRVLFVDCWSKIKLTEPPPIRYA